jgi:type I restriction enzyme S subunit
MSFPKYKAYKHSGIEWLGDVPTHWETSRIRRLFEIKKRIVGTLGYDVLSITQQGLKVKDIESNDGQLSMDYSKYQLVEPGDFAMNQMDLLTGYVDIARTHGVTSPDYRVFSIRHPNQCFDRYYLYLLQNCYRSRIFYPFGQGASQLGRWRLPTDQFKEFLFPQPPVQEQLQIGAFLDHETAKIDMLVEEQQRLIDLLKEKRQAVISRAVTKGLNADAPLKHSGVEWLGEVPRHWSVKKLRRCILEHRQGYYSSDSYVDDGIKLLRITDLFEDGSVNFAECPQVENKEDLKPFYLKKGDFVFARTGGAGTFGLISELDEPAIYASYLIRFRFTDMTSPQFLKFVFLTSGFQSGIQARIHGGVNQNVHAEDIKEQFVAFPPLSEQLDIVTFANFEVTKCAVLIAEAECAIALLQERRNALISAAVTGKIDVRGLVPVEAEAA